MANLPFLRCCRLSGASSFNLRGKLRQTREWTYAEFRHQEFSLGSLLPNVKVGNHQFIRAFYYLGFATRKETAHPTDGAYGG